jgi:hypothetical protein
VRSGIRQRLDVALVLVIVGVLAVRIIRMFRDSSTLLANARALRIGASRAYVLATFGPPLWQGSDRGRLWGVIEEHGVRLPERRGECAGEGAALWSDAFIYMTRLTTTVAIQFDRNEYVCCVMTGGS